MHSCSCDDQAADRRQQCDQHAFWSLFLEIAAYGASGAGFVAATTKRRVSLVATTAAHFLRCTCCCHAVSWCFSCKWAFWHWRQAVGVPRMSATSCSRTCWMLCWQRWCGGLWALHSHMANQLVVSSGKGCATNVFDGAIAAGKACADDSRFLQVAGSLGAAA